MSEPASEPKNADAAYWDEVDAAWATPPRPAPRRLGPVRGGVLAAAMLGLADVLEPDRRDEVVIEIELDRPGEPVGGVRLQFDPASPRRTVAFVT